MTVSRQNKEIRVWDVVVAEITKITSHPAVMITLTITLFINLGFAIVDTIGISFYTTSNRVPQTISDFGMVMFAPIYAFLVLPVIAASSEYRSGQFRMTLTATPNRRLLLTGKFIAMVVAVLSAIVVALVPARLIIGISDGLGVMALITDLGRWIAVYLLMSVVAFGLAGVLRSTIAPLAILILIPIFVGTGVLQWPEGLRFLPDQASMSLLGTPAYDVTVLPMGVAFITLLCWALLLAAVYWIALTQRDS
jgi:hypothetical protein